MTKYKQIDLSKLLVPDPNIRIDKSPEPLENTTQLIWTIIIVIGLIIWINLMFDSE